MGVFLENGGYPAIVFRYSGSGEFFGLTHIFYLNVEPRGGIAHLDTRAQLDHLGEKSVVSSSKLGTSHRAKGKSLIRKGSALLGAFALLLTSLVALPTVATAAQANPGITISDIVLEKVGGGETVTVGDKVKVSGNWDASSAEPVPGDDFFIGLPSEFTFDTAVPFDLKGAGGEIWANCVTDPESDRATCTLTDIVKEWPELVNGTFAFEVTADKVTDLGEVVFDGNGTDLSVDLPGEGGIGDGVELPKDWKKSGALNGNKWSVDWTISVPGTMLAGADQDTVSILETLSPNHQLCDPANLKVQTKRGDVVTDVTDIAAINKSVAENDFAIDLAKPAGGFDENVEYIITYSTCTLNGEIDPVGTQYTNEATINGESSGEIGVGQDFNPGLNVAKTGKILSGGHRDGRIEWNIVVDGDVLKDEPSLTLTDTLSETHRLYFKDNAYVLDGFAITERYGPSGSRQTNVTENYNIAFAPGVDGQSFALEATPKDAGTKFQANPFQYVITYYTESTTEGLPDAGTEFSNAAVVNGKNASDTVKIPNRASGKTGSLSGKFVEIDGTEYSPQTTINWDITVTGEQLKGLDTDLTLTDTLSASHMVCDPEGALKLGDDITSRLNLVVEARDQIHNGGKVTVSLGNATAVLGENGTVIITVPKPDPALDGTLTGSSFSHEYKYVLSYTTCTTSGGMDTPGTEYTNSVEFYGHTFTGSETQHNSGGGTGEGVSRGSVAVSKVITDNAAASVIPADTEFTVHVKEIDPNGVTQVEYDLAVRADGSSVSGPNSRGSGWTIELSEPTFPSVPGVTFAKPVFAVTPGVTPSADGSTAVAELNPGKNIRVELTNTAVMGSAQVVKVVEGAAAALVDPEQEFMVTAAIDVAALGADFPAQPDRVISIKASEPINLDNLPIGATVSFSEVKPADDDVLTWGDPVISPSSIEVTAEHATDPAMITVINWVERTVGTFAIMKTVGGEQSSNPAVPSTVTVTATWVDADDRTQSKELTIPTDGTPVALGEDLLIGTEVTLTETPLNDGSSIAWAAPVWSGTGVEIDGESALVTIGRDPNATVSLENHAATSTAGISLIKGIAGEAAEAVSVDAQFPVIASWVDAEGEPQTREFMIDSNAPTSLGEDLPAGTEVTFTEGERPGIDTVIWGSITISGDGVTDHGDGRATIVISDQHEDLPLITVVNEATWAPGTFSLAKKVTGVLLDLEDVPDSVTVTATWADVQGQPQSKELELPTDGTPVAFGSDLPHLTEVTLTEDAPAGSPSFTWDSPTWAGEQINVADDGSAVLTIGAAVDAELVITNNATATLTSLALTKKISGSGAAQVTSDAKFPVTATWTDILGIEQVKEIEIVAGMPSLIENVPVGVEVQLVEGKFDVAKNLKWIGAQWAGEGDDVELTEGQNSTSVTIVLTGASPDAAKVELTNEFELIPDQPLTGLIPGLPVTGADLTPGKIAAIAVGLLVLVGGGAFLVIRGKRKE
ncbi:DUF5979 domain-containing protein [Jonesiaceae bacterium BS-20]|uniref:DUF5979 domain-containing protein n=1 Tax=Jonesiaceae bacterium BS-20 TaxID=3120821 RepID=A0AAU7DQZ1_9MICO